jgi:hypothetical protein
MMEYLSEEKEWEEAMQRNAERLVKQHHLDDAELESAEAIGGMPPRLLIYYLMVMLFVFAARIPTDDRSRR